MRFEVVVMITADVLSNKIGRGTHHSFIKEKKLNSFPLFSLSKNKLVKQECVQTMTLNFLFFTLIPHRSRFLMLHNGRRLRLITRYLQHMDSDEFPMLKSNCSLIASFCVKI